MWRNVPSQCRSIGAGVLLALIAPAAPAMAAHYMGGNITWQCLGGNDYRITLDLFFDCNAGPTAVDQLLHVESACGNLDTLITAPALVEVSQICTAELPNTSCNGGGLQGVYAGSYQVQLNLPPCPGGWRFWWSMCCRGATLDLVGTSGMYIEGLLRNDLAPCDNSPAFTQNAVPYSCVGQPLNYNFGVVEADGDSLVYALIAARGLGNSATPIPYNPGYSAAQPVPGASIDPVTGQLQFTPPQIGNTVFVVAVQEYDAAGILIGTVMRDIMFVAQPCSGNAPQPVGNAQLTGPGGPGTAPFPGATPTGPNAFTACHGQQVCFSLAFSDPDPATVLTVQSQAATLLPGSSSTVSGSDPVVITVCWTADASYSPVNVSFQVNDGSCPVPSTAGLAVHLVTVVPNATVDAGADSVITVCNAGAPWDLFTLLGGAPQAGGTWTAPDGNPHGAMFDPASDTPGPYAYHVGNACVQDSATVTLAVTGPPDAGSDSAITVCANGAATALFNALAGNPDPGGSWTGPGGAAFAGTYDPQLQAPGSFIYSAPAAKGCAPATATVSVAELAPPMAGTGGVLTVCADGLPADLFAALGGNPDPGGNWSGPDPVLNGLYDPATMAPGPYVYTASGAPACPDAQALLMVSEATPPDAGNDAVLAVCAGGASVSLGAALGTPDPGGDWSGPSPVAAGLFDPATMLPGAYVYAVTGGAPCTGDSATVLVSLTSGPDAGTDAAISLCTNAPATDLFTVLGGTPDPGGTWSGPGTLNGGLFDPMIDPPGNYTYVIAAALPCNGASATVTVALEQPLDAGADGTVSVCATGAPINLLGVLQGNAQPGGIWTYGGVPVTGTFDPASSAPGAYLYTLSGTVCPVTSAVATVAIAPAADAGADNAVALCASGPTLTLSGLLAGNPQAGGTWTGPDGTAVPDLIDPASAVAGAYLYVMPGPADCPADSATVQISIAAPAQAGSDATLDLCSSDAAASLFNALGGLPDAGGTWNGPSAVDPTGSLDPALAGSGLYTYIVAASAPCLSDSAHVQVTITPAPDPGIDAQAAFCANAQPVPLFSLLAGTPDPNGTWTDPQGQPATYTFTPGVSLPGTYAYLLPAAGACPAAQAQVNVAVAEPLQAGGDADTSVCANGPAFALQPLVLPPFDGGGLWAAPDGSIMDGTFDPASDAPGVYAYTVTPDAPCLQDTALLLVQVLPLPSAFPSFQLHAGCAPVEAAFSSGTDASALCIWDLGDGTVVEGCDPFTHLYALPGAWAVSLTVQDTNGCQAVFPLPLPVQTAVPPVAEFQATTGPTTAEGTIFSFTSMATGATGWLWDLAGAGTSVAPQAFFTFPNATDAEYTVCLTAFAAPGCVDSICRVIHVEASAHAWLPNAFSPDGDGLNEAFVPLVFGIRSEGYSFQVFDRWGHVMFRSEAPGTGWDGRATDGSEAPVGVYAWTLRAADEDGTRPLERSGHVTLLR
jgi:gliding motility-associated-like protein